MLDYFRAPSEPIAQNSSQNPATPLHEAARRGDLKMCQILLEHGANPNALDKRNRAPIHLAAQGDFIAIVGELTRVTNKESWIKVPDY
jgi:ankyrin repeat protein